VTTGVNLNTSVMSDLRSAITGVTATLGVSDISDIASAVKAALASDLSDILSMVTGNSAILSDTYSVLTTARAEPAQGAPAASLTMLQKLDYLYKDWRNRKTQTATGYALYADDATTVDHKATFTDDGTTADRGEMSAGP